MYGFARRTRRRSVRRRDGQDRRVVDVNSRDTRSTDDRSFHDRPHDLVLALGMSALTFVIAVVLGRVHLLGAIVAAESLAFVDRARASRVRAFRERREL